MFLKGLVLLLWRCDGRSGHFGLHAAVKHERNSQSAQNVESKKLVGPKGLVKASPLSTKYSI